MYNNNGFTIMELMITVSVAAIIMATAVPSMQILMADSRVAGVASDLASDLKKSRNAAIVARRNHTLVPINATASANVWGNKGWQLTEVLNGVEKIVFQNKTAPKSVTVNTTTSLNSLVFVASTGMVQQNNGDSTVAVFRVCDNNTIKETGVDVLINQFGRVLVQKHANSNICNT